MNVRVFGLGLLPPGCRKSALFREAALAALGPARRRAMELNVIFTTGPDIRAINRRYLRRDRVTDVIAFPYPLPPAYGDVYVCVDEARRQSAELGHPLLEELATLVLHGALHLRGYDDHAAAERRRMFARQDALLRRILGDGKA